FPLRLGAGTEANHRRTHASVIRGLSETMDQYRTIITENGNNNPILVPIFWHYYKTYASPLLVALRVSKTSLVFAMKLSKFYTRCACSRITIFAFLTSVSTSESDSCTSPFQYHVGMS